MSFAAQAEGLAADAADLGRDAALVVASGRAARIAPEATRGLVAAAVTLEAPHLDFYAAAEPVPTDAALLGAASDLESGASDLLREAERLRIAAAEARKAAAVAAAAAHRQEGTAGSTEQTRMAISAAVSQAADCDSAIEILDVLARRLFHARDRLGQVPDDLESAYEIPYAHVRRGGALPHSGGFLTDGLTTARGAA